MVLGELRGDLRYDDTYLVVDRQQNIGELGGEGTFALGHDPGDEIVEIVLTFTLAQNPTESMQRVSAGLDAIGDDATALAAAQSALVIPAPVDPSAFDHDDFGGNQGGTAGQYFHLTTAQHGRLTILTKQSVTSAATVTPNPDANDLVIVTALAEACQLLNPTPTTLRYDGQVIRVRLKDDGTGRALTYDTQYRAMGTPLPATTVATKTLYLSFAFNAADTTWDLIHAAQEA